MNNPWGQYQGDQYPYQVPGNMMGMPPAMMQQPNMPPPLLPPQFMMDMALNPPNSASPMSGPVIGPIKPDDQENSDDTVMVDDFGLNGADDAQEKTQKGSGKDKRGDGRRERDKDRSRQQRSYDRYDRNERSDRNDRDRNDRSDRNDRVRRERRSKWDSDKSNPGFPVQGGDIMMPGMPYGKMNNMNMLGQQQMDMGNMSAIANIPGMQPIMPNMNMMGNMMMMNQPLLPLMPNQPFYVSNATVLPPVPGTSMPNHGERPQGCRTIYVGVLPNNIGPDVLGEIFQRFGAISDIKLQREGVYHVRFEKQESVEQSFMLSGYRFKHNNQTDNEATTLFIDYALNRDDQSEYERIKRRREPTPPRAEPYSPAVLATLTKKIKSDDQFSEAAPTLAVWLERGECNKRNAINFYSLIQASNNQIRRLFNEKMILDDEFQSMKTTIRDKFSNIVMQFEQVAKILTAAKHQRVWDHFTKQQRKNIEMWLKMTEEVENIKEEFNANFDEEDIEKIDKNVVPAEKYEELKVGIYVDILAENENLMYELEGYKNESYLAKDEAERKFEKFKAHFVAQQALQTGKQLFPPLPPPPMPYMAADPFLSANPQPPPPTPDDNKFITSRLAVPPSEAKLISIITAFLLVHPLGASLDYLVSYVRSMVPNVTQATVNQVLQKYTDVFCRKTTGIGASIENKWTFVTFDVIKQES